MRLLPSMLGAAGDSCRAVWRDRVNNRAPWNARAGGGGLLKHSRRLGSTWGFCMCPVWKATVGCNVRCHVRDGRESPHLVLTAVLMLCQDMIGLRERISCSRAVALRVARARSEDSADYRDILTKEIVLTLTIC